MPDRKPLNADKFMLALGSLLREARISREMTQEQLAREAQIDRSSVSRIERGLGDPRVDILIRMAEALGVSALSIFQQAESQAAEAAASGKRLS
jgi:transcriptional regulator with XRE-family HTH domain